VLPFNALPQVVRDLRAYAACGGQRSLWVPAKPLTKAAFGHWLDDAQPGDALQYHEGHLMRDRDPNLSSLKIADQRRVDAVASRVWTAAELGLLHLFSQRIGESHYRYLAIRSSSQLIPLDPPGPEALAMSDTLTPVSN